VNPLLRWLTSPEWTHVVSALLHSLWQGALLAIVLAIPMRRLTNPVTRYRCALGALGVIVIAGIITWAMLNVPESPASSAASAAIVEADARPAPTAPFNSNSPDKVVAVGLNTPPAASTHWTAWLALAWMSGAMVMLLRAGIKVAGAENLRRSCQPLKDERMLSLVAEACHAVALARKIRVAVTDKLTSPAVVGVLVPTLILPLSLFSALTPEQIRFVLLHELAHIRRGDYLANLFQLFAEALLFFNPAVWWISHQIRREREASCDALAIELSGAPADYAKTLVRVAENILQPTTSAALAFGDDGREPSPLADRVQRLLVPGYRPSLRLTWRAILTSLIVGGTLLVLSAIGTRNTVGAILTSSQPTTSPVLLAPEMNPDVQPKVSGDDSNFLTTNIPTLTEFVGYDLATAATFVPTAITGTGQSIDSVLPLPIFRVRQTTTSNNAPFLGDLPVIGKLFTSEASAARQTWFSGDDSFGMDNWTVAGQKQTNQQWFWYRTDGQTKASQVPVTSAAIPSEPLVTRSFEVDVNGFYAVVRKAAGIAETVAATNLGPAFRTFFAQAGVNLDPQLGKSFFFSHSRGDMQVRATRDEMDVIERLLKPLAGIPLSLGHFQIAPQRLADARSSLPPEINSILATNPAAGFRALLESFDPTDPRPKRVHYNSESGELQARATEADLKKFATALNVLPLPRNQIQFKSSANSNAPPALATRTFQVVPEAIAKAIEAAKPEFKPVTATNVTEGLRALFQSTGADLSPPKSIYYNNRAGGLFVRATKEDLDTIESLLRVIEQQPPQVNIKVAFVEIPIGKSLPKELAKILAPITPENGTNFTSIIQRPQFKALLRALENGSTAKILAMPQVTTLSGRQAQIQVTDVKTIVSGMTAVVTNGKTNLIYQSQAMPFGPVLDVLPIVWSDGRTIQMTLTPTFTEFLGYEDAKKLKLSAPNDKAILPLPVFRTRQITTSASVWDGQTIVLGNFSDEMLPAPSVLKSAPKTPPQKQSKQLLVFVTPTIIDPAGNQLNSSK